MIVGQGTRVGDSSNDKVAGLQVIFHRSKNKHLTTFANDTKHCVVIVMKLY